MRFCRFCQLLVVNCCARADNHVVNSALFLLYVDRANIELRCEVLHGITVELGVIRFKECWYKGFDVGGAPHGC